MPKIVRRETKDPLKLANCSFRLTDEEDDPNVITLPPVYLGFSIFKDVQYQTPRQ